MIREILDEGKDKKAVKLQDMILSLIEEEVDRIETYDDVGMMTNDAGLVITIGKDEYQLTIVQSR